MSSQILGPLYQSDLTKRAIPFAWGDATPKPLFTVRAGKRIPLVSVVVTTAFDGAGAALTIGDANDTDRLMTADQNDPASVWTYEATPGYAYASDTALTLSITPGAGATAGAGTVYIELED